MRTYLMKKYFVKLLQIIDFINSFYLFFAADAIVVIVLIKYLHRYLFKKIKHK